MKGFFDKNLRLHRTLSKLSKCNFSTAFNYLKISRRCNGRDNSNILEDVFEISWSNVFRYRLSNS